MELAWHAMTLPGWVGLVEDRGELWTGLIPRLKYKTTMDAASVGPSGTLSYNTILLKYKIKMCL